MRKSLSSPRISIPGTGPPFLPASAVPPLERFQTRIQTAFAHSESAGILQMLAGRYASIMHHRDAAEAANTAHRDLMLSDV